MRMAAPARQVPWPAFTQKLRPLPAAYMPGRVIVDLGARTQRHWPGLQLQAQARAYLMTHFYQPSGQAIVKTRFVRSRRQMI